MRRSDLAVATGRFIPVIYPGECLTYRRITHLILFFFLQDFRLFGQLSLFHSVISCSPPSPLLAVAVICVVAALRLRLLLPRPLLVFSSSPSFSYP